MLSVNKEATNKRHWLDKAQFQQIVAATPLISLDLIVRNAQGQVLLGRRLNPRLKGAGLCRVAGCAKTSGWMRLFCA